MLSYDEQTKHMNKVLEIIGSLSEYNHTLKEGYERLKLIKEKHDISVLKKNKLSKLNNNKNVLQNISNKNQQIKK